MLDENQTTKISKFLSLVLRHNPGSIGIELDQNGWTRVRILIAKVRLKFPGFNMATLEEVVANNNKQRFSFNDDKTKIRANQGHSVEVDLEYEPMMPPELLFHGTVGRFMKPIMKDGLQKMSRHHVHLSKDLETAISVGGRRGEAIILQVNADQMHRDGYQFFMSPNGVWLTDHVPSMYIVAP